jgi:hypothetical protein
MTTPTNFSRLPQAHSTHMGRVVLGGVVSQLALALKQLQGVKFRAAASYHIGRTTFTNYYWAKQLWQGAFEHISKGHTEDHDLFLATMPSSEWLAIEITYACAGDTSFDPYITIELYAQSAYSFKHSKIDDGIKFESPLDISTSVNIRGMEVKRASTGAEPVPIPSGGFVDFSAPRPLYIPAAYRGQVLTLCIQTEGALIYNVNVFDIYQEAT